MPKTASQIIDEIKPLIQPPFFAAGPVEPNANGLTDRVYIKPRPTSIASSIPGSTREERARNRDMLCSLAEELLKSLHRRRYKAYLSGGYNIIIVP